MEIINRWLNGTRNFIIGTTIYNVIGKNLQLKALLAAGATPFAEDLLFKELQAFSLAKYIADQEHNKKNPSEQLIPSKDTVLNSFYEAWAPRFQKLNFLRHSLDRKFTDMNSDEAIKYRQPLAAEILELEKQVKHIWAQRDYYIKHGKLPFVQEPSDDLPTDPEQIAKLLPSIKRNVRRNRQLMKEQPDNPNYAALYEHYKTVFKKLTGTDYEEKN